MTLVKTVLTIDHCVIIVVDPTKHLYTESLKNALRPIADIIDKIQIFTAIENCLKYLVQVKDERISMIFENNLYEKDINLYRLIETLNIIHGVYILSIDPKERKIDGQLTKIKGYFQDMRQICHAIEQDHQIWLDRSNKTSLIASNVADTIDSSFIYSKLLTEVIIQLEYDGHARKEFFEHLIVQNLNNLTKCKEIQDFAQYYSQRNPIWWYTRESFIHSLVNHSLIVHDYMTIIKMGFFIQDLFQGIHSIYKNTTQDSKMIVYRGQTMNKYSFDELQQQKQGGLYAFSNFLSTSSDLNVAMQFTHYDEKNSAMVGILFEIEVELMTNSSPFAILSDESYAEGENEVLFAPHTIFRVGEIKQLPNGLWKVYLTLTSDEDRQRTQFIKSIRDEVSDLPSWIALGIVLYRMGAYENAINTFERILGRTDNDDEEQFKELVSICYNNVGVVHHTTENYSKALELYKDALQSVEQTKRRDSRYISAFYNNIGMVHYQLGNHKTALTWCQKALAIRTTAMDSDSIALATTYSNLGKIYEYRGDFARALSLYKQAEAIERTHLSQDHPMLTTTYNNFGRIYSLMGDYSLSLSFYQKTLDIYAIFLPNHHPLLAMAYNNVGYLNQLLGDYAVALYYYERAIEFQENIPTNRISRAILYSNIAVVYRLIDQHSKALEYQKKALIIQQENLPTDHSSLAVTYNNIAVLHQSMENSSEALLNYEKALEIWQKILHGNHSSLAILHNNIGSIYDSLGDYDKARSSYEKSLEILQGSSISNPLDLATVYNNIGEVDRINGQYEQALSSYEKAYEIEKKMLPANHLSLAITLSNIAVAHERTLQLTKAIDYAKQADDIVSQMLDAEHHQVRQIKQYLTSLRQKAEKK